MGVPHPMLDPTWTPPPHSDICQPFVDLFEPNVGESPGTKPRSQILYVDACHVVVGGFMGSTRKLFEALVVSYYYYYIALLRDREGLVVGRVSSKLSLVSRKIFGHNRSKS